MKARIPVSSTTLVQLVQHKSRYVEAKRVSKEEQAVTNEGGGAKTMSEKMQF